MSTGIQDWLYPINSASDYRLGGMEEDQSDLVTRGNLWESLLANPNEVADWHLSSGFRLMPLKDTDYAHFDGRKARLPSQRSDRPAGKLLRRHAALLLPT
jgi:hypothetical protein